MSKDRTDRTWIRPLGALAVLVAALFLVAACGGDVGGGSDEEVTVAEAEGEPSGELNISNWPFYIDKATVPDFEEETGITVEYNEDVNDNASFFGKIQPLLQEGDAGG